MQHGVQHGPTPTSRSRFYSRPPYCFKPSLRPDEEREFLRQQAEYEAAYLAHPLDALVLFVVCAGSRVVVAADRAGLAWRRPSARPSSVE